MITRILGLSLICSFLCACSGHDEELLRAENLAKNQLIQLGAALQGGKIRNAVILREYCDVLRKKKPELQSLLTELEKEATVLGPLYNRLEKRLQDAAIAENYTDWQERLDELISIRQAANPDMFNDALSDTVNVVADLSDGDLKRVNALTKQQSMLANKSKDYGYGSQYIGNPHYGRWQRDHTGMSFWAWYGMYSMFSDLTGGRRHYYSHWSQNRGYSYYHDIGRRSYTSPKQRYAQDSMEQRTRKQFGRQGKKFNSTYQKRRTGASRISKASRAQTQSPFKSGYAKSNRNRSSNLRRNSSSRSSFRSGYGRTSRGFSRGK